MALKEFLGTSEPEAAPNRPRLSVLYVEDEDVNWEVALLHLEGKYLLTRATTSREAFDFLAQNKYHVILMDIQLGGSDLNGIEITQILRGTYDKPLPAQGYDVRVDTPIIFMTAYAARYPREELLMFGGDDLLVKPVNFVAVASVISRVILKSLQK